MVNDAWSQFFLICFLVGVIFTALAFLFGLGHDLGGLDFGQADAGGGQGSPAAGHDVPFGHSDGHGADAAHSNPLLGLLNLNVIMAFVAWFGGIGYILYNFSPLLLIVIIPMALGAGLLAGWLVSAFLRLLLRRGQRILNPADFQMEGTIAKVSLPIRPGRVGEIIFSKDGTWRSEGARSADDSELSRGEEVVVVRYERGLAYVQSWERYVNSRN